MVEAEQRLAMGCDRHAAGLSDAGYVI